MKPSKMKLSAGRIFGPVPSRRLGLSLGVDLLPFKTCTLDCIYCQCGKTKAPVARRSRFVSRSGIIRALKEACARRGGIDWITFSGSGEPTLSSDLGALIRAAKNITTTPVAVITNSTLLKHKRVREAIAAADLVVPTLSAGSASVFGRLHRPHPRIRFDDVVKGLKKFVSDYRGRVWLEVMLVKGINDSSREMEQLGGIIAAIKPERVQLNTVVRPPAASGTRPLNLAGLKRAQMILKRLLPQTPVEIVTGKTRTRKPSSPRDVSSSVIAFLKRRPGTARDLSRGLGVGEPALEQTLRRLANNGKIIEKRFGRRRYYAPNTRRRCG